MSSQIFFKLKNTTRLKPLARFMSEASKSFRYPVKITKTQKKHNTEKAQQIEKSLTETDSNSNLTSFPEKFTERNLKSKTQKITPCNSDFEVTFQANLVENIIKSYKRLATEQTAFVMGDVTRSELYYNKQFLNKEQWQPVLVRPAKRQGKSTPKSTPESNKIKVLVLCNGIGMSEPVIYHQTQNKVEQVQNFRKTVHSHISDFDECITKFLPKMDENSSIINLSSFASFDGWAGEAAFAAGCAATQKMTLEYSRLLAPKKIRINSIAYNVIRSEHMCFRESQKFMHKEHHKLSNYSFLNLNYEYLRQEDGVSCGFNGWSGLAHAPDMHKNTKSGKMASLNNLDRSANKIDYNDYKVLMANKKELIEFDEDKDANNLARLIKFISDSQYLNGSVVTQGGLDCMTL